MSTIAFSPTLMLGVSNVLPLSRYLLSPTRCVGCVAFPLQHFSSRLPALYLFTSFATPPASPTEVSCRSKGQNMLSVSGHVDMSIVTYVERPLAFRALYATLSLNGCLAINNVHQSSARARLGLRRHSNTCLAHFIRFRLSLDSLDHKSDFSPHMVRVPRVRLERPSVTSLSLVNNRRHCEVCDVSEDAFTSN